MTQKKRRFFSGPSLPAALVAAASEHGLQPEEIEYRLIEKKHGFLKVRRNVVIEVDPEAPRKASEAPTVKPATTRPGSLELKEPFEQPPAVLAADAEERVADDVDAGTQDLEPDDEAQASGKSEPEDLPRLRPRRRPDREDHEGREDHHRQGRAREARPTSERFEAERSRSDRGGETRAPSVRQRFSEKQPDASPRPRQRPERETRRPAAERRKPAARESAPPLPIEKRCRKATGALAECALEAVEWLLDLVDLDVDPSVYDGDERLEIELRGPDREILIADSGKALAALEHLVPRVMRGVCGEAYPCRVDSENYQELREERLRDSALEVAARVRHEGRAEILEPMDPADRRIIHVTLSDDEAVTTRSLGEGFFKRVKVLPAD